MRKPGWESRLTVELRVASARPFEAKTWNCARFAHVCAQAVRGAPIQFRRHGSLEQSVDRLLPRVGPLLARRGDVVMAEVPHRSLGICLGRTSVFLARNGLLTIPMDRVTAAWSV